MNNKIYGVINSVYYNNIQKDNEISERLAVRNVPSATLQPQFSSRPISSKYEMMPIFDRRAQPTIEIKRTPIYNSRTVFNPGTAQAPWAGYSTNINVESKLRNQFFALQRNEKGIYIPSTKSDLYNVEVKGDYVEQPYPQLFEEPNLAEFNPNKYNVGKDLFNNNTRVQYKNIDLNKNINQQNSEESIEIDKSKNSNN